MKTPSKRVGGFSLVEVALALGILSFCMITLMALMPEGVRSYRDADAQSTMVNIASLIVRDLQATPSGTSTATSPQYGFSIPAAGGAPSGTTPQTVYVDATGTATATTVGAAPTSASIYRISVYFIPPTSAGQTTATLARIQITFPAQADPTPSSSPTMYTDIFQTVIYLNRN